ncbi:MAG: aldolase/citrate lyase family protein [Magnetospiraceae bacterium]
MPAPVNLFKQNLLEGKRQIGSWIGLADAFAAEISATAGFDWLVIDGEHSPNDLRSIMRQLQALAVYDVPAVVRLPKGEEWIIKQTLDAGAQTLLIPMVESGEQAKRLVEAIKYPPEGIRGVGSALARASAFAGIADYLPTANAQTCLVVQVESRAGVAALDDILAVDGVDGVFLGPSDLAADMGYLGKPGTPIVQETVLAAIEKVVAAGKAAGILTTDKALLDKAEAAGASFLAVGIDVTLLANGLRALAASYKA